jgi:hypothetical protein
VWTYQGNPILETPQAFGFVYEIENLTTGRRYIGKKQLQFKCVKPPLKGKRRRRRSVIESDWRTYWGSCAELLEDIKTHGETRFQRRILKFCASKSELGYAEVEAQVKNDVLTAKLPDGQWAFYNANIMNRFFRKLDTF